MGEWPGVIILSSICFYIIFKQIYKKQKEFALPGKNKKIKENFEKFFEETKLNPKFKKSLAVSSTLTLDIIVLSESGNVLISKVKDPEQSIEGEEEIRIKDEFNFKDVIKVDFEIKTQSGTKIANILGGGMLFGTVGAIAGALADNIDYQQVNLIFTLNKFGEKEKVFSIYNGVKQIEYQNVNPIVDSILKELNPLILVLSEKFKKKNKK
jgi:hypothetical protein